MFRLPEQMSMKTTKKDNYEYFSSTVNLLKTQMFRG